ncbi:MAG: hypothetical protein P4N59_25950 [Negativicutes bacterium]|nr:hypothetical protein [Negativicutes bacterium]
MRIRFSPLPKHRLIRFDPDRPKDDEWELAGFYCDEESAGIDE